MNDPQQPDTEPLPTADELPPAAEQPPAAQPGTAEKRQPKVRKRVWQICAAMIGLTIVSALAALMIPWAKQQLQPFPLPSVSTAPVTAEELVGMDEPVPVEPMAPDPVPVEPVVHEPPPLDPKIRELLERVDLLLSQDNDANLYLAEKIDGFADRLDTMAQLGGYVTALDSRIALLEDRIVELTKHFPANAEISADVETSPESPPGPPFRLIAIDRWQKKWNAVLEFEGKVTMIEPPSSVAGWQLLSIDAERRTAIFRNGSGNEIELTAG